VSIARWIPLACVALVAPTAVVAPTVVVAQTAIPAPMRPVLAQLERDNAWTLEQQVSICEVAAPPFKEQARAAEYKRRLEQLGLRNVRIDAVGNVIAERPGRSARPLLMIGGHLDTVFPEGTDVTVKKVDGEYRGPGIGDDCRGLAAILAIVRAFEAAKLQTNGTIVFVATVGEEGPGNLRGVRHLITKEYAGRVDQFVSVDGTGIGVTSRAVGSHRYTVRYKGPGGHSYGAFGMPNPIHAAGRAIAKIADLKVPAAPKTTFSVGVITGGTSVNSISTEGSFDVDMRSESAEALQELDGQFRAALNAALAEEKARWPESKKSLELVIDTIGIRPADGRQRDDAPIVVAALNAARAVGRPIAKTDASSTDANVPMALGIPAITVDAGGVGTGAHGSDERYTDGPDGFKGPQFVALLIAALVGLR
jgi:acetylornithine deacetylase/succinyl-diaminopimelate desuccinylase-like protein